MNHSEIYSEASGRKKKPEINEGELDFLKTTDGINESEHNDWLNHKVTQRKMILIKQAYNEACLSAQNQSLLCNNDQASVFNIKAATAKAFLKLIETFQP